MPGPAGDRHIGGDPDDGGNHHAVTLAVVQEVGTGEGHYDQRGVGSPIAAVQVTLIFRQRTMGGDVCRDLFGYGANLSPSGQCAIEQAARIAGWSLHRVGVVGLPGGGFMADQLAGT